MIGERPGLAMAVVLLLSGPKWSETKDSLLFRIIMQKKTSAPIGASMCNVPAL